MRPAAVTVEARAKLNLSLAIGPRRRDGFHELATIFQSISLADTLHAVRRRSGFGLEIGYQNAAARGQPGVERLPADPSNLVLRAARVFAEHHAVTGGARFRLTKRIPSGTGLGGGSADAAAALVALRALLRPDLTRCDLLALAAAIGADVPLSLTGGTAVGTGRGEILAPTTLDHGFRAILAVPEWRMSTRNAYRRFDRLKYSLTGWRANLRSARSVAHRRTSLERALSQGNGFEAALGTRRPALESLRSRLLEAGVTQARMTGSGSAMFGILPAGAPARAVAARFRGHEALYLVHSTRAGVRLRTRHDRGRW